MYVWYNLRATTKMIRNESKKTIDKSKWNSKKKKVQITYQKAEIKKKMRNLSPNVTLIKCIWSEYINWKTNWQNGWNIT